MTKLDVRDGEDLDDGGDAAVGGGGGGGGSAPGQQLSGWLLLRGGSSSRRWFVLKEDTLCYFRDESACHEAGSINLRDAKSCYATVPHGDGLETPAVARTRVAATPVASRGVTTRDRLPLRRATSRVPGSATTTAATPIGAARRVAETPAATTRAKQENQEKQEKQVTGGKTSEARVSASKRRAGSGKAGLASFGAMVREGRELAETERGGGAKRARR